MSIDHATLDLLNVFAGWLSAIGTLAAVVVALHLARRDHDVRVRVRAGRGKILLPPQPYDRQVEVVSISATNVGLRPVTLTAIYWRDGLFRKTHTDQRPPSNDLSTRLPAKLNDGEEATIVFELPEFEEGMAPLLEALRKRKLRRIACRSLRAGFCVSSARPVFAHLEPSLCQWFYEASNPARRAA